MKTAFTRCSRVYLGAPLEHRRIPAVAVAALRDTRRGALERDGVLIHPSATHVGLDEELANGGGHRSSGDRFQNLMEILEAPLVRLVRAPGQTAILVQDPELEVLEDREVPGEKRRSGRGRG